MSKRRFVQIGNHVFNEDWELINVSDTCVYTDNCPFLVRPGDYCKYYDNNSGVCMYLFTKSGIKILMDVLKNKEIFDE